MQQIIYKIFNIAEAFLIWLGTITGLGYEMVNYLLFIYIQPGLIILLFILWRREKKKKKIKL
jgi:O-antigen/teichoic acid export membrane protein